MSVFAHETAVIASGARIGRGTKVWHFCHIMEGAEIGDDCSFGQGCFVAAGARVGSRVRAQNNVSIFAGVTIEDDVFLGPSCVFTNVNRPRATIRRTDYEKTLVRRGATIGANATITAGITLGAFCFVGAGAVVTTDVPDHALVVGVPARRVGWVSRSAERLSVPDEEGVLRCPSTGEAYVERAGALHPV